MGIVEARLSIGTELCAMTRLRVRAILGSAARLENGDDFVFQFLAHTFELAGNGGLVLIHGFADFREGEVFQVIRNEPGTIERVERRNGLLERSGQQAEVM